MEPPTDCSLRSLPFQGEIHTALTLGLAEMHIEPPTDGRALPLPTPLSNGLESARKQTEHTTLFVSPRVLVHKKGRTEQPC